MPPTRRTSPACRTVAVAVLAVAALALVGCQPRVRLWADTARLGGALSPEPLQYAYDGERVRFVADCGGLPVTYVVVSVEDAHRLVEVPDAPGQFGWTHTFRSGPQTRTYTVYAVPFLMRERRDWFYDKADDAWHFYPPSYDKPDKQLAPEESLTIVCYRREVRFAFEGRGGKPRRLVLNIYLADGRKVFVPEQTEPEPDEPGVLLLGPGEDGLYEAVYTPTITQVNRAGTTRVELVIVHADGSLERVTRELPTP